MYNNHNYVEYVAQSRLKWQESFDREQGLVKLTFIIIFTSRTSANVLHNKVLSLVSLIQVILQPKLY